MFVAQSILFSLNNSIDSDSACLTLEEYLCLRVIYFVFIRIWVYTTLGILTNDRHHIHLESLLKYVSALDKALEVYRNYVDAVYCVRIILEISDDLTKLVAEKSTNLSANAEVMDEILADAAVQSKLVRDISPSLYQSVDLYRRQGRRISEGLILTEKAFAREEGASLFPLMDKIAAIGVLGKIAMSDQSVLNVMWTFFKNLI